MTVQAPAQVMAHMSPPSPVARTMPSNGVSNGSVLTFDNMVSASSLKRSDSRAAAAAPVASGSGTPLHDHHGRHHHHHPFHHKEHSSTAPVGSLDRASSMPPSAASSASGSKNNSFIGTPRLLSRRGSSRGEHGSGVFRASSLKGKAREEQPATLSEDGRSPAHSEVDVIETPQLRLDRDPETGRKMINQYLVLHEIGHGTHGRVRLGRDMSAEGGDDEGDLATGSGPGQLWAIKIVERNPKKKRLNQLGRQRGLGGHRSSDGGKLVAENEIRKEIAIFKKVSHPNVVRMKEIIDDPDSSKLFMVLEYCEGGEVRWKTENGPELTLAETRKIFRDTVLGLEYLHHQGIIHRDIKPSNLLMSGDTVKISDFGCSHYSEALLAAWAEGEDNYIDDIDLAKTAGSPAFFAPEMCYSELPDDMPQRSPVMEAREAVPTFTIRPPSTVVDDRGVSVVGSDTVPYSPGRNVTLTMSRDSQSPRPSGSSFSRTQSTATIPRKPRLPITNAIDVWALGVTFYCLLFGKTPFDAANEYLLMQEIPKARYAIPATMGRDQLPTGADASEEVKEALDLLSKLLEKDAPQRITLDAAKHHPFTLRGLADPQAWLMQTDLQAQSFVTVTNDEVAAAVTRGGSIRDKVRRGINKISSRLNFLGRNRSQSNADLTDANGYQSGTSSGGHDMPPPPAPTLNRRVTSGSDAAPSSGGAITGANLARRLSLLSRDRSRAESPRPAGLLASQLGSSPPQQTVPLAHPQPEKPPRRQASVQSVGSAEATPRQRPSVSSLDKFRVGDMSPSGYRRRQSCDVGDPRPRSSSNASSSTSSILGALGRNIFSHSRSLRSTSGRPPPRSAAGGASEDNAVFATSIDSHSALSAEGSHAEFLRGRSFDDMHRRPSNETFASGSPGSQHHMAPSPDRQLSWDTRFRNHESFGMPPRRGSTLSEDIRPVIEDEEVDWDGSIPDSDQEDACSEDYDTHGLPKGHGISSAPVDWNINAFVEELDRQQGLAHAAASRSARGSFSTSPRDMSTAHSLLRSGGGIDMGRLGSNQSTPLRAAPPSSYAYRAKSPLGTGSRDPSWSASSYGDPNGALTPTHNGSLSPPSALTPDKSADRFADAEEDEDDGGLVLGRRRKSCRSRRGSTLSGLGSGSPGSSSAH